MKVKLKKVIIWVVVVFGFSILSMCADKREGDMGIAVDNKQSEAEAVFSNSAPYIVSEPEEKLPVEEVTEEKVVEEKEIIFSASEDTKIDKYNFTYSVEKQDLDRMNMGFDAAETYSDLEGITCFRGSNFRDGGSFGYVKVEEERLERSWEVNIGSIDSWTGVGWNGQPSIVKWGADVKSYMNIYEDKKNKEGLTEVIYAALDGYVHFIDLEDGRVTRDKLKIGAPIKGSLTIDPRGYPIMYVGQGIDKNAGNHVSFAYRIFSLLDFKKLYEIKGNDSFALRRWGAFDSTSLIDKQKDFFYLCGENGVFYSGKLNTKYEDGKVSMSPVIDKYRYGAKKTRERGIENSVAIYDSYGFFADNDGVMQCLDLKTLKPVWTREVSDDTDSTIVLERDTDGLNLYTACEVDKQGNGGYSYVRKINGATGELLWENKYKCAYDSGTNGGALATPISGKEDIKELVIFNIARTPQYSSGLLVALDKKSGREVWRLPLESYCWSSPVALYTREGKSYIVQCDSAGRAFLIEGISGKILDTISLGANVEGTPAAFNDTLVVGTRGSKIIGFKVK